MQPPYELPYKVGQPIPPGYRLNEEPRWGLVSGGWILLGIPYGISLASALSADFKNESVWLVIPVLGPWMTIGRRDYYDCDGTDAKLHTAGCVADTFVVMGLIFDGVMQIGGATMVLLGYTQKKKTLVREQWGLELRPGVIGSGYGALLGSAF